MDFSEKTRRPIRGPLQITRMKRDLNLRDQPYSLETLSLEKPFGTGSYIDESPYYNHGSGSMMEGEGFLDGFKKVAGAVAQAAIPTVAKLITNAAGDNSVVGKLAKFVGDITPAVADALKQPDGIRNAMSIFVDRLPELAKNLGASSQITDMLRTTATSLMKNLLSPSGSGVAHLDPIRDLFDYSLQAGAHHLVGEGAEIDGGFLQALLPLLPSLIPAVSDGISSLVKAIRGHGWDNVDGLGGGQWEPTPAKSQYNAKLLRGAVLQLCPGCRVIRPPVMVLKSGPKKRRLY